MEESIEDMEMAKTQTTDNISKDSKPAETDQASQARRRLLKLGAYVPPAIIGMAIIGKMPQAHASSSGSSGHGNAYGHHIGSCMPSACKPCIDYDDDEHKDKDKYDNHKHQSDRARCEVEKAKKEIRDKKKKRNKDH